LRFGPPARREEAPAYDPFEAGWQGYYEGTFNPARVNLTVTRGHMAKKYWKNLPETAAIPDLVRTAPSRVREMIAREAAMPMHRNPAKAVAAMADQDPQSLQELNRIIAAADPMVEGGVRAVLGEGPVGAALAFVGEQPGDQEDLQGRPFVGLAGQVLDRALAEVGIDRSRAYVTNAVKHFKYVQRGKRRLHQRPTAGEVTHYRWWLKKELDLVGPRLVVALGATAVLALAGKQMPIAANRGEFCFDSRLGYVTVHPSHLLRIPDESDKAEAYAAFCADLARAGEIVFA
jgi:DNA polymerase